MDKFLHFGLAMGAAGLTWCWGMSEAAAAPDRPAIENLSPHTFTTTMRADYLLFLPKGYDPRETKRWPLIVFLHGSGERGTNVWRTAIHGPTKFIEKHPEFPFIFVSPQCPDGSKWSDDTLLGLIDSISANYSVDTNRIYLTGLSMGGYGTWSLATTHPERFAAVAPICGGEGNIGVVLSLADKSKVAALKRLPVWAFHGAKDNVVDVAESERMVKIFQHTGNTNVTLTIYPEAMHNSWTETYDNPKLYEWFLQHQFVPDQ